MAARAKDQSISLDFKTLRQR